MLHLECPHRQNSSELRGSALTATGDRLSLEELSIDTIRTLSMDAVQKINQGHPGAPMGLAPVAYTLFTKLMRHNPANPTWIDRDRFILSAGHASMLLYASLFLSGYPMTLDDIEHFRVLGWPTAGHPEYWHSPGIEATTGPLGQGLSMAVGLALAERMLAARFNVDGHDIVDHFTWVIASDGDIQEGVASEASSLAGHLGLGKLIVFYDDNRIQLASPTSLVFSEDVARPLRGLRLARSERRRGHLTRQSRRGRAPRAGSRGPAVADHLPHAYRLRQPEQAGLDAGPRLGARRGRGPPDEGVLRLGPRQAFLRAGRGARGLAQRDRAARRGRGQLEQPLQRLPHRISPSWRPSSSESSASAACQGLGQQRQAELRPRHHAVPRDARGLGQDAPVGRRERSRARRRFRRPGEFQRHRHQGRW